MPRFRTLILIAGDFFFILLSYCLVASLLGVSGILSLNDLEIFFFVEDGWRQFIAACLTLLFGIYWVGLYDHLMIRNTRVLIEDLLLVFGSAFLLQAMASYLRSSFVMPRWIMIFGSLTAFLGLIVWRLLYGQSLIRFAEGQRILIVGYSPLVKQLIDYIRNHPETGYVFVGCIPLDEATNLPQDLLIAEPDQMLEAVAKLRIVRIFVYGQPLPDSEIALKLLNCSMSSIPVQGIGNLYEDLFQQVSIETVTVSQLIFSSSFRPPSWVLTCQEIYGRCIAFIGILLTWPLMLLTALAVRLDSEGPALLRQKRVGCNGKIFEILKFRSMYVDADKRFGRTRASGDDPRITRVGRWIRLTRLDELPQFFNVLRGEMMLVGPRPEMPVYVEELSKALPLYPQRHRVKPGITGWAQLHHQPEYSTEETKIKIQYDLYYIKNISIAFDLLIMFHTIRTIILRIGAR